MKVLNVRCHVGAQIGARVFTSLDSKVNGCDMEMNQFGVFITGSIDRNKIDPHFIPHSTIASIKICPDAYAVRNAEPEKNKGGRPPKSA